jgi:hypothetical protein
MKDTFIDCKKFRMGPGMRPLVGEYLKTIIVVRGASNIGKSTLCDVLWKEGVNYISLDGACILERDHQIEEIHQYLDLYGDQAKFHLNILCQLISESKAQKFMDYFFKKYIEENENLNILLDGFLFTFENVYRIFLEQCVMKRYRVWQIERVL